MQQGAPMSVLAFATAPKTCRPPDSVLRLPIRTSRCRSPSSQLRMKVESKVTTIAFASTLTGASAADAIDEGQPSARGERLCGQLAGVDRPVIENRDQGPGSFGGAVGVAELIEQGNEGAWRKVFATSVRAARENDMA